MVKPRYRWVESARAGVIVHWKMLRPGVEQVIGRKP